MSAQIIAALHARADQLESEARTRVANRVNEIEGHPEMGGVHSLQWLAREFRQLADTAQIGITSLPGTAQFSPVTYWHCNSCGNTVSDRDEHRKTCQ